MSFFFVLGPVPTEACPDCVGSGKSVYDRLELLRAHAVLVAHPAIVEVSQVNLGRGPIEADKLVGPRQRVEVTVPSLALRGGLLRLVADG